MTENIRHLVIWKYYTTQSQKSVQTNLLFSLSQLNFGICHISTILLLFIYVHYTLNE